MLDLYVLQVDKGKFDLAQFLISKNCPINGIHNHFVFSFFFSFKNFWKFLFSLSWLKSLITTERLFTSGCCMYKQQFGYCKIIITKWSTSHCSSLLVFLITFLKTILSLLSFFLFFLSIYHQFGFGKTGNEYSSSSLQFLFCYFTGCEDFSWKWSRCKWNLSSILFWFFFNGCFWVFLIIFFLKGRTPLMTLIQCQEFRSIRDIVLFMLKNGAEINKTNEVFLISLIFGVLFGNNSFNPKW